MRSSGQSGTKGPLDLQGLSRTVGSIGDLSSLGQQGVKRLSGLLGTKGF